MAIRIGIGPGLGEALAPDEYWRWVDYCESSAIDSIWHSDQLLGASLEPVTTLAALAARTGRMRFGTNALVIAFRDPVVLAKELATIDFLSGGRLLPVFGVGGASDLFWSATGADPKKRGARSNEAIELVRLLLGNAQVVFEGDHYRYHGPGVSPRRDKVPPLWIGGHSKAALKRTARLGDGWLAGLIGPSAAGKARKGIEAELGETGRRIPDDHYGATIFYRIGSQDDPAVETAKKRFGARVERALDPDSFLVGSAAQVADGFRRYVNEGISKFVALPIAGNSDDLMAQTAMLSDEILPLVED